MIGPSRPDPMIQLRTLGTVDLRHAGSDRVLDGALCRPKRLAVLAYLAVEGGVGAFHRRDTLLGIFWPESSERNARHSLSHTLYALRRDLGFEVIRTRGDTEVSLASDAMWCDVQAFRDALAAGDLEGALALYGGDLLPGFHLSNSVDFEAWLSRHRDRLRALAVEAARSLAVAREADGNSVGAVRWLRRAAEWASYDEDVVRELLRLLDLLGDHAGALLEYQALCERMSRDLDLPPSPETRALASRIRGAAVGEPAAPSMAGAPEGEGEPARGVPAFPAGSPKPRAPGRALSWRRAAVVAPLLAVALVGATVAWRRGRPPPPDVTRFVVLPFEVRGPTDLSYLSDGMALLLGATLDGAGPLRGVDPRSVLRFVESRHGGTDPAGLAAAVVRRFGAGAYVSGTVVGAGGRLSLHAVLHDADGTLLAETSTPPVDEAGVFEMVDRVARELVGGEYAGAGDRLVRLAALTTPSLPALKAYLEGERAYRAGRFVEASSSFERAALADTAFALAHYRLSLSMLWADVPDTLPFDADARAIRHADGLANHDRMLIRAYAAWRSGQADRAEDVYRNVLTLYPDDAEAWHQLGETLFHYNPLRGRPVEEARGAFERVLQLDPDNWGALWHLMLIAGAGGRPVEVRDLADRLLTLGPDPGQALEIRAFRAYAGGDPSERGLVAGEIGVADPLAVYDVAWRVAVDLHDPTRARELVRVSTKPDRLPEPRRLAYANLAFLDVALGQDRAAARDLDALEALGGGWLPLEVRTIAAVAPMHGATEARLGALRRTLLTWRPARDDDVLLRPLLLSLVDLALGDTAAAGGRADSLALVARQLARGSEQAGFVAFIRAAVDHAGGRDDEAMRRLEETPTERWFGWATTSPIQAAAPARWLHAELLERAGRHREALSWYASFGEHSLSDLVYLAPAHVRSAAVEEALGDTAAARAHLERSLELWSDADPSLAPIVRDVRAHLAGLGAGTSP